MSQCVSLCPTNSQPSQAVHEFYSCVCHPLSYESFITPWHTESQHIKQLPSCRHHQALSLVKLISCTRSYITQNKSVCLAVSRQMSFFLSPSGITLFNLQPPVNLPLGNQLIFSYLDCALSTSQVFVQMYFPDVFFFPRTPLFRRLHTCLQT